MELTLVVMAAGIGSRFGGTKQIAPVGPAGEAIVDYTIHDARRAGFERVVVIVRSEIEDMVASHLRAQHGDAFEPILVCQDQHGPQRDKPWGTGHAVAAAASEVSGPFAVVNADDFYGRQAYTTLADALRSDTEDLHLVGYELAQTLSPSGSVSRGVCDVAEGYLVDITEHLRIERDGTTGRIVSLDHDLELAETTTVSMNLWGLRPWALEPLVDGFESFVDAHVDDPKAEYQLPTIIRAQLDESRRASVLPTGSRWFGVTYPDDLAQVQTEVQELVTGGVYPSPLA